MEQIDYKELIENSSFGYAFHKLILDDRGNPSDYEFLAVNSAFEKLTGLNREFIIGRTITDVVPGIKFDSFDWIGFYGGSVLDNDCREFEQYSQILKRWYRVQVSPYGDLRFVTMFFDITEQKNKEKELKEIALFKSTLLDAMPAPVYYKDINGKYLGVNKAFSEFYGKSNEEMIGKDVYDIASPELSEIYKKMDDSLLSNPGLQIYENHVRDSNGHDHEVIFNKTTFPDADGKTGGIIGVILDITERKNNEKELGLYFKAIQSVDQPLLITDSRGNIMRVNKAFLDMYGYTLDELIGENPRVLNPGRSVYLNFGYTEDEYKVLFKSMWREISDSKKGTWENVVINRKKDGTLVWVRLLINTVYDENHKPVNYIALPMDISKSIYNEMTTKTELYRTIASIAELRDNETGNHMRRVGIFSKLLAREYRMPEKYCNDIEVFSPLHDIGKVGILDSILLAERKLTPDEFEIMKSHTHLGYNIVKGKKELEMVAAITIAHHEWFNGNGYPNNLSGEDIPLSGRITSISDVYDALRSKRPYKEEWSHEKARDYIISYSGTQFDPKLVDLFSEISDRFDSIYNDLKD